MKYLVLLLALAACNKHEESEKHAEDRHEPALATPPLSLAVTIDGSAATWPQAVFDRTAHFSTENHDGDARDTWSLRELAHEAGPNARVITVIGDKRQAIDAAAWSDPAKTPIIHRTRRGGLKFRWTDSTGAWGPEAVKDVTGLELTAK